MQKNPKSLGYRMPAEWEKQESVWISWPHNEETWPEIGNVEESYAQFAAALHEGQKINILVNDERIESRAGERLKAGNMDFSKIIFHNIKNVDGWIRDYGPVFIVNDKTKHLAMVKWVFNAWGSKYEDLKEDGRIPYEINKTMKLQMFEPGIVLEGGSIEVNGSGTILTTEQCLLNKNRNSNLAKKEIEDYLKEYLNASNILWLKSGIEGDDTDGHIDDIARFVGKNKVVCAFEENRNDSNHKPLKENYEMLKKMKDEDGNTLDVIKLPMPGIVEHEGTRLPASYANFYIGNDAVAVPVFGHENDRKAIEILQRCFPTRRVTGINCRAMVYGMGTLHCCSQQQPWV